MLSIVPCAMTCAMGENGRKAWGRFTNIDESQDLCETIYDIGAHLFIISSIVFFIFISANFLTNCT